MEGLVRVLKRLVAVLNLVGTILAMNNTHTIYSINESEKNTKFYEEKGSYPTPKRIINHSEIDFSKVAKK